MEKADPGPVGAWRGDGGWLQAAAAAAAAGSGQALISDCSLKVQPILRRRNQSTHEQKQHRKTVQTTPACLEQQIFTSTSKYLIISSERSEMEGFY